MNSKPLIATFAALAAMALAPAAALADTGSAASGASVLTGPAPGPHITSPPRGDDWVPVARLGGTRPSYGTFPLHSA